MNRRTGILPVSILAVRNMETDETSVLRLFLHVAMDEEVVETAEDEHPAGQP